MFQLSGLSVAATVILLLICFILPLALFYFLFKYADGKAKLLATGAVVFLVGGFILEMVIQNIIYGFVDMQKNTVVSLLYYLVLSPLLFILMNFLAVRFFGHEMNTTGDSLMYATGYTGLQNMLMVGFAEVFNLLSVLSLGGAENYIVVSDSDYASYSDMVSASNLLSESNYNYLNTLCNRPASYIFAMCIDRLFIMAAYAAILIVLWMAVRKQKGLPLLAVAFGMRVLIVIPSILNNMNIISNVWLLLPLALVTTVISWAVAIVCRNKFIDNPDVTYKRYK